MTTLLGMAEILRLYVTIILFDHYIRMPSRYYKILLPVLVFGAALILCVGVGYSTLHKPQIVSVSSVATTSVASSTATETDSAAPSSLKTSTLAAPVIPQPSAAQTPVSTSTVTIPASYLQAKMAVSGTSYALAFPSGSTVEAAMKLLETQAPPFTFTEHEYPGLGEFVDSINGKANADGNYWFLYVNGIDSPTGVTDTILHSGDSIEWKYEHQ